MQDIQDPTTQEEWEEIAQRMDTGRSRGLEAWLPRDYVEAKRLGKPYKYDDGYLEFGKKVRWLSDITLKMLEQVKK